MQQTRNNRIGNAVPNPCQYMVGTFKYVKRCEHTVWHMSEGALLFFRRILDSIVEFVLRGARCAVVHWYGFLIRGQDAAADVLFLFMIIFRVHSVYPRTSAVDFNGVQAHNDLLFLSAHHDEIHPGKFRVLSNICGVRLWLRRRLGKQQAFSIPDAFGDNNFILRHSLSGGRDFAQTDIEME